MSLSVFTTKEYLHFKHDLGFAVDTLLFEAGARPDNDTQSWRIPLNREAYLLYSKVYWYIIEKDMQITIAPESLTEVQNMFNKYDFATIRKNMATFEQTLLKYVKFRPYLWQLEANYMLSINQHYNLWMDAGLGKTKVILDDFRMKKERDLPNLKLFVFCPNYLVMTWEEQIKEHQPDLSYKLLYKGSRNKLIALYEKEADIYVTNIEGLAPRYTDKKTLHPFFKEFKDAIRANTPNIGVIDEASRIKRPESKQTKYLLEMKDLFTFRRGMTGSPVTRDLRDVWSQLTWLDDFASGYNTYNAFISNHFKFDDWVKTKIKFVVDQKVIEDQVGKWCLIKKKENCLDLPEKIRKVIKLQMTATQKKMYETMKHECFVEFQNELRENQYIKKDHVLAKMAIFQQIAKGFIYYEHLKPGTVRMEVGRKVHPLVSSKYATVVDLLKTELWNKSTIIWTAHAEERARITKILEHSTVSHTVLYPKAPPTVNKKKQDDFNRGVYKVIVLSFQSHSMGINLPSIDAEIFLCATANFNAEYRIQAEERGMRANRDKSKKGILSYDIITIDTIEEQMKKDSKFKINMAAAFTKNVMKVNCEIR